MQKDRILHQSAKSAFCKKIALGTVQFGLDYGISNNTGKIGPNTATEILTEAYSSGIRVLDTAAAYGNSESVLSEILANHPSLDFGIVSKLAPVQNSSLAKGISRSLAIRPNSPLYGYLIHDFNWFVNNTRAWEELVSIKSTGKIRKIGFSLYHPEQAEWLLQHKYLPDILQFPYNVFDQRFAYLLPELKNRGIEIHVRSVFLQGLFFLHPEQLKPHFFGIKQKLLALQQLFASQSIPVAAGLLNFAWLNEYIDQVIIGVSGVADLQENVNAYHWTDKTRNILPDLKGFVEDNSDYILPINWK